jgi:hypothetical protein
LQGKCSTTFSRSLSPLFSDVFDEPTVRIESANPHADALCFPTPNQGSVRHILWPKVSVVSLTQENKEMHPYGEEERARYAPR